MGIDYTDTMLSIENVFGITISEDEAQKIETVGELFHFILNRLEAKNDPRTKERDTIWLLICQIIYYTLAISPKQLTITESTHFARDIGR